MSSLLGSDAGPIYAATGGYGLLSGLAEAFLVVVFVRVILSWFPISPDSGLASLYNVIYTITEPVLGPLRRVLPSVGFGGMGLDLSPLIVILALQFIIVPGLLRNGL